MTDILAGYSSKDELVPGNAPTAAFLGYSLLSVSIPLATMWRRRTFSAVAAVGAAIAAAAAYPPVVDKIPFHPSATNMFRAAMELSIVGHPLVMAAVTAFAASYALGAPRWLVTGLASAPLAAVAYVSYHIAGVIASSNPRLGPADIVTQLGLYIIAGAAVAGAVVSIATAALSLTSSRAVRERFSSPKDKIGDGGPLARIPQ